MKKILGLDLGSASIGWAMVQESENSSSILGLGSRIIPYEGTEGKDFEKGTGESKNSLRTKARTARKGYDRYQQRRKNLVKILYDNEMYPTEEVKSLEKKAIWNLRSVAPNEQILLPELGRILLWLNQKRGYKSSRADANLAQKDTDYVAQVKSRHQTIKEQGLTIGQFFHAQITQNEFARIKEQIFPREAYIEEYDSIMRCQKQFYPKLSDAIIAEIRNEIIYYQRQLKSQKGLVSVCEFEGHDYNGNFGGPKVAPKSSPLFQLAKIWENVNNIKVADNVITTEQKRAIFEYLNVHDKISEAKLKEFLKLPKDTRLNGQLKNGLTGNKTYSQIASCFGSRINQYSELFRFNIDIIKTPNTVHTYDKKTGEVVGEKTQKYISEKIVNEPYYRLWHTVYSIKDKEECEAALVDFLISSENVENERVRIEKEIAEKLASLDLSIGGFGNKSAKVIRKILPYFMEGDMYSVAMDYAGYNHSAASVTSSDNAIRKLEDSLKHLPKNSLRQPVVEKILNQMINLVNGVIELYGRPDEIRVELVRELKQSKEERNDTDLFMRKRKRENELIKKDLARYGLKATRNNVIKWRLYHEIEDKEKKLNAQCIYCGQLISLNDAILGNEVEVEHIIPKAKLFDDSQSNKTLAHRHCNAGKGDKTALDFMKSKSNAEFESYLMRVEELYKKHLISGAKRSKFLMSEQKIPSDFIDRQLRESQYIARKAREILMSVSRNVWCTGGSVTAHLRKLWGWDDVTMNLQFPKYKELGMTEVVEWESEHGRNHHSKEIIKEFSKRDDHRHHAIDALVVACTKQGYIQRINTLTSSKTRDDMYKHVSGSIVEFNEKHNLLDKYLITQKPFTTEQVESEVATILVSFKAGKKAATLGKRKIGRRGNKCVVQSGIIVPRGALSEESVYGKIKVASDKKPMKYLFENPCLIFKPQIKELVEERLAKFDGDTKKALASLKKDPIYLDEKNEVLLEWARCYCEEYVIKYKVDINFNKVGKVIDKGVRGVLEARLAKFAGKEKEAFKEVKAEDGTILAWWQDEGLTRPIYSVRCRTGLSAVVPVKHNENGKEIGFVKPGNNHHVAIYRDANGVQQELVTTFWNAVERQKFGLPAIIKHPAEIYDKLDGRDDVSEQFLSELPNPTWTFEVSMQQNEMFVMGMSDEEFEEAINTSDYSKLSQYLYRVQKLSTKNYCFRHHLETKTDDKFSGEQNMSLSKDIRKLIMVNSFGAWNSQNPKKVKISIIGKIAKL